MGVVAMTATTFRTARQRSIAAVALCVIEAALLVTSGAIHLHLAQTTNRSLDRCPIHESIQYQVTHAADALVIQVLLPFRMNPPSTSSAVVSIPAGSEP